MRYLVRPRISTEAVESPPLLCFLHGYDEGAPLDIFNALRRHGPFRSLNQSTYKDRFVIVAPQLPVRGDLCNRYADTVGRIVLEEAKRFACDLRRLYLTGFSFGGNGVFDLSFAQTGIWAALWPVDPTRVPTRLITIPIWLSLGEISRLQAPNFIRILGLSPPRSPRQPTRFGPMQARIMSPLRLRHITKNGFTAGFSASKFSKSSGRLCEYQTLCKRPKCLGFSGFSSKRRVTRRRLT